jgi:DNA polymerase-1
MIQEYRGYQKTYTAFIEGTLERMRDGRIYPRFNVNGTVTGRISSSDPNMQQLPAKGEWAKVRGIYIPDTGNRLITCDYGMLEVVIAAHFSQDPNLLKIIYEGASKHDITAQALGISRSLAKTLNFAMQYQCSPRKVRQIVGCSERESEHIWNKYWETYAGEKRIVDECKQKVDRGEAIVNPFGRRRRFPARFDSQWRREAAYRQAYSSLIQGTGADCTHWAFYSVGERLVQKRVGVGLFEVHDEIVIQSAINSCAEAADVLKSTMLEAGKVANLTVPLTVDCSEPLVRWEK